MMKKILAATDGSDAADRSLEVAAELAAKFKAELVLLYVARDMLIPERLRRLTEVEDVEAPRQAALKAAGEAILDSAREVARARGVKRVQAVFRAGNPADCIVQYARVNEIDLIVLGSRGLGNVKGMLMGSVSRKVTNLADVSCLTVR